jgi:hypothetical protein
MTIRMQVPPPLPPPSAAEVIDWCEEFLPIPDGRFVGQPLEVAEYMREDFRGIFDNKHGTRRAIITRGRKNGKSIECAMLVLAHLVGPAQRQNAQLYSIAQSRDQAAIIFSLAAKMVRMSSVLRDEITVKDGVKELHCPRYGTMYKALSAETSTAFGKSPALCIVDEAGQVRGPRYSPKCAVTLSRCLPDSGCVHSPERQRRLGVYHADHLLDLLCCRRDCFAVSCVDCLKQRLGGGEQIALLVEPVGCRAEAFSYVRDVSGDEVNGAHRLLLQAAL